MKIGFQKTLLVVALAFITRALADDWSWGRNGKSLEPATAASKQTEKTSVSVKPVEGEGRNTGIRIPHGVLPLQEAATFENPSTAQEFVTGEEIYTFPEGDLSVAAEIADGEEGRSGRFLGISNKLCKLGIKGMCGKPKGYPPSDYSHYEDTIGSTYTSHVPQYIPISENKYPPIYPNTYVDQPKPFTNVFSDVFKNKKTKGSSKGYNVPLPVYGVPEHAYNVPQPSYQPPENSYVPVQPSYQPPINSYGFSGPEAQYQGPKEPKPIYSAPQPSYKQPSYKQPLPSYGSPKPSDVVHHKILPQKAVINTHIIEPTQVKHIHTHTHVYGSSPFDIRKGDAFPRDDGSYHSASEFKATVNVNPTFDKGQVHSSVNNDKLFSAVHTESFGESFLPSQPLPFIDDSAASHSKRRVSHADLNEFNSFGDNEQSFQSSIAQLTENAFAAASNKRIYPIDCQCVPRQYCSPSDLVARTDSNEINNLLDARNINTNVLSNYTLPDDYYDYDYLRTESENNSTTFDGEDLELTTIYSEVTGRLNETSTEEEQTTEIPNDGRVRRSAEENASLNSTDGLSGRQLTGFTPGVNGCGHDYVCCRRPVYIAAQRSSPSCGRGNPSIHGRVSNFEYEKGQSDFGEYPWQAAILRDEGPESMFVCGATLIDDLHVLTAAHCVNDLKVDSLKVRLGEWDVNRDTEFYNHVEVPVAAVIVHPEFYKGNLYNDIAIVKLASFVDTETSPHISPVCLPAPNTDFTDYRCQVTGWGKDAFGDNGKFQHILKELVVPVIPHKSCEFALQNTRLGREYKLHEGFICAGGEEGKDACKGDGGGPLVCYAGEKTFQLAGIVSWGIGCGVKGVPGVYVNIPYYVDWIRSVTYTVQ